MVCITIRRQELCSCAGDAPFGIIVLVASSILRGSRLFDFVLKMAIPGFGISIQEDDGVVQWIGRQYTKENFRDRNCSLVQFVNCQFSECDFDHTQLHESRPQHCIFEKCSFLGAKMNSSLHKGTAFINCRFDGASLFVSRFEHCKMTGSTFCEADLSGLCIQGGDWSYTNLRYQSLPKSDLQEVRLQEADLYHCNLKKSNLRNADLSYAVLSGADLRGARIVEIDLKNVISQGTRIDLGQAIELAKSMGAKVD